MLVQTPRLDCSPLGDARRLAPHRSRTRGKAFSDQFDSWDLAVNRPAISCHPWPLDNEAVREPAPNEEPRVDTIGTVSWREALTDLCRLLGSTVTGYCRAGQQGIRVRLGSWTAGWLDCGRAGCPGVGKR